MHGNSIRSIGGWIAVVAIGTSGLVSGGCTPATTKATFYVAPDGNDEWSGRRATANSSRSDGPFATIHRARDAVRELKATGKHDGPYVVMLCQGTYYLDEPLVLDPNDSGTADRPVIYTAWPDEKVTLSGGRAITGWHEGEGDLWYADVPAARGQDGWRFRQLFVGHHRQIRARTPNFDPEHPRTGGWAFVRPFIDPDQSQFGKSLVCIHTPGDTFTWKINVPADGEYALWFLYGAQNKPHGRTTMAGRTRVRIDDGPPVWLQNLPDTGAWHKYRWAKTATLTLTKGTHTLRWTNVKGGGLDWDAFLLTDAPNYTPKGTKLAPPPKGKHVLVVQAEAYETAKAKESDVRTPRGKHHRDRFRFRPGDIRPWPRSPAPEIHIFPAWGWVNAILSIDRVDHDEHICYVTNRNCSQELRPGNRYFVEGVFEALDMPGEWFLDCKQGRVYYWPVDSSFVVKGVIAPALDRLIVLRGEDGNDKAAGENDRASSSDRAPRHVEHVHIRGITFRHTTYSLEAPSVYSPEDAAIQMTRARHCTIEDCTFLGVGGYAIRMGNFADGNKILGNTILDAGQGGVTLKGDRNETQPTDNVIAGNRMHHLGAIWKHVAGVFVSTGSRNRIAHNTITDVPRYGASLKSYGPGGGSHENIIEYNRILRTNLETNDTGAIETLGRDRQDTGNVIRYNLILDSIGLKTSPTGEIMTPYYTWGIYLDDYSSGTDVYGNIVARTYRGGLHVHLGRNNRFVNNIFVDGKNQQAEYNGGAFMSYNVFARNIVYYHTGALHKVNRWHDEILAICENNLYWRASDDPARPQDHITPKGSLEAWRAAGYDRTSIVADPMFVDPARDDYRLHPYSPAFWLGFEPIDVSRIGARGYRAGEY